MNIEEKNFYEATKLAGKDLIHYHLCENDRGIPGTGLVNWDDIFRALAELYDQGYAAPEILRGYYGHHEYLGLETAGAQWGCPLSVEEAHSFACCRKCMICCNLFFGRLIFFYPIFKNKKTNVKIKININKNKQK